MSSSEGFQQSALILQKIRYSSQITYQNNIFEDNLMGFLIPSYSKCFPLVAKKHVANRVLVGAPLQFHSITPIKTHPMLLNAIAGESLCQAVWRSGVESYHM